MRIHIVGSLIALTITASASAQCDSLCEAEKAADRAADRAASEVDSAAAASRALDVDVAPESPSVANTASDSRRRYELNKSLAELDAWEQVHRKLYKLELERIDNAFQNRKINASYAQILRNRAKYDFDTIMKIIDWSRNPEKLKSTLEKAQGTEKKPLFDTYYKPFNK